MEKTMRTRGSTIGRLGAAAAMLLGLGAAWPGGTYTQSAGPERAFIVPMGHEWITRLAAMEVLGAPSSAAPDKPDPHDPRRNWAYGKGLAWNPKVDAGAAPAEAARIRGHKVSDSRYASHYKAVYDAVIGERWVDLAGHRVGVTQFANRCWTAVAQEAAEAQYDHFMRRYDDAGPDGGVRAARESQARFVDYFVAAATAPKTMIRVQDGGAATEAQTVDRNYFLFGRAVHLFQDSFSSEHTVRIAEDNYVRIRQVKSYACAKGAEQHSHSKAEIVLRPKSGDVIWTAAERRAPGWSSYTPSNMKPTALVATEASRDLWAAFIRTMALPQAQREAAARAEAQTLVAHWLSFDEAEMRGWYDDPARRDATYVLDDGQTGKGKTQTQCMEGVKRGYSQASYVAELKEDQRVCLYNVLPEIGYEDQFDPQTQVWYAWRWRNAARLQTPPAGWRPTPRPADTSTRVRLQSVANGRYVVAPVWSSNETPVYAREGAPLEFSMVGPQSHAMFRSVDDPGLFLDYRTSGAMMLFARPVRQPPAYGLAPAGQGWSMRETSWNQYVWLNGDRPYLNRQGDPKAPEAQWRIEGLR